MTSGQGPTPKTSDEAVPVIGVGASAGGLAAFDRLLSSLSRPPGLAIVLVTHLSADDPGLMPALLARSSVIGVTEIADGVRVEPDVAYMLPARSHLRYEAGHLYLEAPGDGRPHLPIDHFFRSLADGLGERAAGVVLSGTGSDGTMGLEAIRAAGRDHVRERRGERRVHGHARQRDRQRRGRSRVAGRRDRAADRGPRGAARSRRRAARRDLAGQDPRAGARRDGPRLRGLQEGHADPPHRAPPPRARAERRRELREPHHARRGGALPALPRSVGGGDLVLSHARRVRGARREGVARDRAPKRGARRADARLGRRVLDRAGGLFARDDAGRDRADAGRRDAGADLRDRHRSGRARDGAPRPLPGVDRRRRLARAPAPVLRARGRVLPRDQLAAREGDLLAAQRDERSPVLAARSARLPQPAHLPRARAPAPLVPVLPLRAAAGRSPVPRGVGERG